MAFCPPRSLLFGQPDGPVNAPSPPFVSHDPVSTLVCAYEPSPIDSHISTDLSTESKVRPHQSICSSSRACLSESEPHTILPSAGSRHSGPKVSECSPVTGGVRRRCDTGSLWPKPYRDGAVAGGVRPSEQDSESELEKEAFLCYLGPEWVANFRSSLKLWGQLPDRIGLGKDHMSRRLRPDSPGQGRHRRPDCGRQVGHRANRPAFAGLGFEQKTTPWNAGITSPPVV